MADGDAVDWRGLNRANWDDRVPVHLASEFYDLKGFRAGASSLRRFETAETGDVTGKRLVHLQCHDRPLVEDYPYSYTDGPALEHTRSVEFQHQIGQVVTALADAGLRIDFLHEHDFDVFQRFESLERHGDEYRFPAGQPRVPMRFSLRATCPA